MMFGKSSGNHMGECKTHLLIPAPQANGRYWARTSDLQLVELAGARTGAILGHLPCLSARLPDLGSPRIASGCHSAVRDVFGESL
jgi:hypothetical protein